MKEAEEKAGRRSRPQAEGQELSDTVPLSRGVAAPGGAGKDTHTRRSTARAGYCHSATPVLERRMRCWSVAPPFLDDKVPHCLTRTALESDSLSQWQLGWLRPRVVHGRARKETHAARSDIGAHLPIALLGPGVHRGVAFIDHDLAPDARLRKALQTHADTGAEREAITQAIAELRPCARSVLSGAALAWPDTGGPS